jgi:uncharacterized membrane protein YbhN (UPF0104 family)
VPFSETLQLKATSLSSNAPQVRQPRRSIAARAAVSTLLLAAVVGVVGHQYGFEEIINHIRELSPAAIGVIEAGLLANALMAALRFKVISTDAGHPIGLRQAMAAVGAGSLGGALFFQIAGQLMARSIVLRRGGVPFDTVVVATLYERIVAAGVSALLALLGALYIFGQVKVDQSAGGTQLITVLCGLGAAIGMAGWLGFGSLVKRNVWPLLTRVFVFRLLRIAGLTVLVQLPMMAAYSLIAHQFSPYTPVIDVFAASAIVMFAASVPVSLAGWGIREISAVVALGAVGISASSALTTAVIVGAGSLLAMGAVLAISVGGSNKVAPALDDKFVVEVIDYSRALGWMLPLTAAVFVLFQIYVPLGSGLLNVNLADPVAILGGSLFVLRAVGSRQWPTWRVDHVNLFVLLATLALGFSLLLGASRFGWTNWALVNRFAGWFVLLAYAATGALITSLGGMRALSILALTYVGATAGVVIVELALLLANAVGAPAQQLVRLDEIEGFSQNHNFLAFQMLIGASALLTFIRSRARKEILLGLLLAGLWFAGSRSGWISIACLVVAAIYLKRLRGREALAAFAYALAAAVVLALVPIFMAHLTAHLGSGATSRVIFPQHLTAHLGSGATSRVIFPQMVRTEASVAERLATLAGGWKLFVEHPVFGAGLGAFRNEHILSSSSIPLVIHSTPLWLLAELGLVGFLAFAIPGLYVWVSEWRRATYDRASALVALCFLAFAIMSGFADMVYQRTFWLIVGGALAVSLASTGGSKEPGQSCGYESGNS